VRFLLDESADFRLAPFLRDLGHNVTAIAHDFPQSLLDTEVLAIALRERRTLITNDRDFGEMIVRGRTSPRRGHLVSASIERPGCEA
jgi:predicted nuclease of predicted toxin-antitoxin system